MKTLKLFYAVVFIIISSTLTAQDTTKVVTEGEEGNRIRPFQLTFITPMGTNGIESGKYTNIISFNMFAGYSGGLQGVEFGGFSNAEHGNVRGAQFAGFTNVVTGNVYGAQFSGFTNVVRKDLTGGQFTGFSNVVVGNVSGIQACGFSNVVKEDMELVQIAGFSNVVNGKTNGAQIAGFMNVARKDIDGFQLAGFANVAANNAHAVQIAGFSNTAKDTLTGVQISGFINTAKHVNGSQIGFINVCDSMENGIPLGFLSIVKKGYHKLEVGGSESFYATASVKLGVPRFYNILSMGIKPEGDMFYWGPGYGIGTELGITEKMNMNIDVISYAIFDSEHNWKVEPWEGGNWDYEYSSLNTLSINLSRNFTKNIALYGGPSFNVLVSNETDNQGNLIGTDLAPYKMYKETYDETVLEMYLGFKAGLRFF